MICLYRIWYIYLFIYIFKFHFFYFSLIPLADNIYSVMSESKLLVVWLRCECDKWNQFMASHHLNSTSLVSKKSRINNDISFSLWKCHCFFHYRRHEQNTSSPNKQFSVESYIYGYSMAVINTMEIIYKKKKRKKVYLFLFEWVRHSREQELKTHRASFFLCVVRCIQGNLTGITKGTISIRMQLISLTFKRTSCRDKITLK